MDEREVVYVRKPDKRIKVVRNWIGIGYSLSTDTTTSQYSSSREPYTIIKISNNNYRLILVGEVSGDSGESLFLHGLGHYLGSFTSESVIGSLNTGDSYHNNEIYLSGRVMIDGVVGSYYINLFLP
jgi:hypothetical protein